MTGHLIADRRTSLLAGVACFVLGSYLIWDAYEARGRQRPWGMRWLPG